MKAETKEKKKSGMILNISTGIFVIVLSISIFFLIQIIGRMNRSAYQSLLTSSRVIRDGLDNKMTLDRELVSTLVDLLCPKQEDEFGEILQEYADSTDFYRFSYINMAGEGTDSQGNEVHLSDIPFDETALSKGEEALSAPYQGSSGRLQITYQSPVIKEGKQIGAVYADRIINDYNLPGLFIFHNGAGSAYVVDGNGSFIINSRGTATEPDIYNYLIKQGNGTSIQDTLREVIQEGKSGTLAVMNKGEKSLLGFLPVEAPEGCYLITVVPREVLQQEAEPIIVMLCGMFGFLLVGGISISVLLSGRQSMKANVQQKEYREKLFENLSANIDFAFLLYSPAGQKVELVSNNLTGILGISAQQAQERPEQVFEASGITSEDPARICFLEGTLKEQISRESMVGTGPNEVKRWIAVHLIPADYGQFLAVIHETTEEHNMREQLADALTQAQDSNQARTAFFSSLSHDIRTPMNGIMGMTNIALNNLDNREKVESCLLKITAASDHLLELINEVLDMSRIESGRISLKEEMVHLPSLIANLLSFIKPDMEKKGLCLQMKPQDLEYDTIISDTLHLQKVLLNLLSNAVKYTQDGGRISLQISETLVDMHTIRIRFVIKDNGIGMSPEFLDRIFLPFERAEDSRMSKIAGTGLGLAITKNIIDLMDGNICVESRKDEGSCFTVDIPVKLPVQQETVDTQEHVTEEHVTLEGVRILIAEDNELNREIMEELLADKGALVDSAQNGREALDYYQNSSPGYYRLILMDVHMPEMNGLEATKAIRNTGRTDAVSIPVIAMTADVFKEDISRCMDAGMDAHIGKPVEPDKLYDLLRHYLDHTHEPEEM